MSLLSARWCGRPNQMVGVPLWSLLGHTRRDGWRASSLLLVVMVLAGVGAVPSARSASEESGWHEFSGIWTAAGRRQDIALGSDRRASVADYSGSLMLYGTSRPALGFRAEAVVFNDSATGLIGRAVWTDEADNHVYSELRSEAAPGGNRIVGTFVGGSGRYEGASGTYAFSWRFLLEGEDGVVQGQSTEFSGKVRLLPTGRGPGAGTSMP